MWYVCPCCQHVQDGQELDWYVTAFTTDLTTEHVTNGKLICQKNCWLIPLPSFLYPSAAGSAFCQAARLHMQLQSKHDSATSYVDAGNAYKKADPQGEGQSGTFPLDRFPPASSPILALTLGPSANPIPNVSLTLIRTLRLTRGRSDDSAPAAGFPFHCSVF